MIKIVKKVIACAVISACVAGAVCALSACNSNSDYTDEFTKLQQQIDNLKSENSDLKNQISSITPSDKDYAQEIADLKQQIENQQKLIESLQNGATAEPKIYKIGETFTYSYQGIDYFSIKFEGINSNDVSLQIIETTVTNLNMPSGEYISSYIRQVGYSPIRGHEHSKFSDTALKTNESKIEHTSAWIDVNNVYFGFPIGENSVIPYAILDLTVSP